MLRMFLSLRCLLPLPFYYSHLFSLAICPPYSASFKMRSVLFIAARRVRNLFTRQSPPDRARLWHASAPM